MPEGFGSILSNNLRDLGFIGPEVMVALTFLVALVWDFSAKPEWHKCTAYLCLLGLIAALRLTWQHNALFVHLAGGPPPMPDGWYPMPVGGQIFAGMLVYDHFGTIFKLILLLGTLVTVLIALHARELEGRHHGEFYLLLLTVCLGGMFLSSATNLLMIYLSIETLSVVSYALAGYLRRDRKSAEAGIKYVMYGATASALMLFGMSYLYGLTGTLDLLGEHGIAAQISAAQAGSQTPQGGIIVVLALVFTGFFYKIAVVPFHYWTPDVYEGAPTTATGFFSVVPKAAGFAVLIRVLCAFFPPGSKTESWFSTVHAETVLAVIAVATMTLGNLAALGQTNAKRLLAYSSIAQAGYMLAGLAVLKDTGGLAATVFYIAAYLFMNLGAFLVLVALENRLGGSDLSQLRGAIRSERVLCVALCVFLFSLTGVPPLAGFMGKWLIMVELASSQRWGLIVWIGINSVISLYYYMKLAKTVALDAPAHEPAPGAEAPMVYRFIAIGQSVALVALFIYAQPALNLCKLAVAGLKR